MLSSARALCVARERRKRKRERKSFQGDDELFIKPIRYGFLLLLLLVYAVIFFRAADGLSDRAQGWRLSLMNGGGEFVFYLELLV